MSWKFVFNTTVSYKYWGDIQEANDAAKNCGYQFFTWNGWVYTINGTQTNIKVQDCF